MRKISPDWLCRSIAFVAICIVSVFVSEVALASDKKPLLHIEESTFDFGSVNQGAVVHHEFVLKNKGEGDLIIQRIVAACGCTASSSDKEVIAPGESGAIKVDFNTTGFSGNKLKTVRVYTNDFDQPSSLLSLRGRVEPTVSITPTRLYYGNVTREGSNSAALTQEVSVKVREGQEAKIKSILARSKYLEIKSLKSTPKEHSFLVTLSPEVPLGEFRERIIVSLDSASAKTLNVPVFASVKGPIQIKPTSVAFGVLEGAQALVRSVKLENKGKERIDIIKITSSHPAVTAEFTPIKDGKVFVIKVSVNPGEVAKDLRASLQIETSSEKQKKIPLSVYGILPPRL